jgi:hypothetical protein
MGTTNTREWAAEGKPPPRRKRWMPTANHGDPSARLEQNIDEARQVLQQLPALGISLDEVTRQLEKGGC